MFSLTEMDAESLVVSRVKIQMKNRNALWKIKTIVAIWLAILLCSVVTVALWFLNRIEFPHHLPIPINNTVALQNPFTPFSFLKNGNRHDLFDLISGL